MPTSVYAPEVDDVLAGAGPGASPPFLVDGRGVEIDFVSISRRLA